jgi:hypothetical protein
MLRRPSMAPDERRYRAEEALTLAAQTPTIVGGPDLEHCEWRRLYKALVRQDPQPSDHSVRQQRSGRGSPRSAA